MERLPWTYEQGDPAIALFTKAYERWPMPFLPGQRIIELGCAETDWLERMHALDPTLDLHGVDARRDRDPHGWSQYHASAIDAQLFREGTFDWVVMLGALEHFGLGYYGDPVDDAGDVKTMQNVVRWLKPGGHVYFDVPFNPTYRVTENRHFRIYNTDALALRLIVPGLMVREHAFSLPEPDAGTWIPEPTEDREPYHFVAVWAERL